MKLFALLSSLFFFSNSYGADFVFEFDGLCFQNGTEELREFGPLGRLGDKKGVCQGMSGIVSAFHEGAVFNPSLQKLSESEAYNAIQDVVQKHTGGCRSSKVIIGGYANLQDFCKDHKKLFLSKAIAYNTDIAIREIAPQYLEFNRYKKEPVNTKAGRKKIHEAVLSLKQKLEQGRWPLMLYFSHVVSVFSVKEIFENGKLSKVIFAIYDSNYATSIQYEVNYDLDDLPAFGQKMIWEITPERSSISCF